MRKKLFPKFRRIELLNENLAIHRSQTGSAMIKNVAEAFRNASKVFTYRYQTSSANQVPYWEGRNWWGSNVPMDHAMRMQFGAFISVLLNTPCEGRTIKHWLLSKPINNPDLGKVGKEIDSLNFLFDPGKRKDFTSYEQVIGKFSEIFKQAEGWLEVPITRNQDGADRLKQITYLFNLLIDGTVMPIPDGFRVGSFIWACLIKWANEFALRFSDLEKGGAAINWMTTKMHNLYISSAKPDDLFETFQSWFLTTIKMEQQKMLRDRLKVDFSKVEIKNGTIYLPFEFFNELIKLTVEDTIFSSQEFVIFETHFAEFKQRAIEVAKMRRIAKTEGWECSIDGSYDILLVEGFENFQTTKELVAQEMNYFHENFRMIDEYWKKFIDQNFTSEIESFLPRASVRVCVENGIRSIYRFTFDAPHVKTFQGFRVKTSILDDRMKGKNKNGDDMFVADSESGDNDSVLVFDPIVDIEQPFFSPQLSVDPTRQSLILRKCKGHFGSVLIPEEIAVIMKLAFRDDKVEKVGVNKWNFVLYETGFTIKPPLDVVRNLDLITDDNVPRGERGLDYRLQEFSLIDKVNLLDLWFCFPRTEVEGSTSLESLYNSRLSLFSKQRVFGVENKFLTWPWDSVVVPNYSLMLSFSRNDFANFFQAVRNIRIVPSQFSSPLSFTTEIGKVDKNGTYATIDTSMSQIDRIMTIKVPVHKTNIKMEYLKNSSKTGAVLFESTEKRGDFPRVKIINEPFSTKSFEDCLVCELTFDLLTDVAFNEIEVLKSTRTDLTLDFKVSVPGFESLDPTMDECYFIRNGESENYGKVSKDDLHTSLTSAKDEIELWAELAAGLIRDILLISGGIIEASKYDKIKKDSNGLVAFAHKFFVTTEESLIPINNGAAMISFAETFNFLKKVGESKNLVKELQDEGESLIKKTYGSSFNSAIAFGPTFKGSYYSLLEDVASGVARMPAKKKPVSSLRRNYEFFCFNDLVPVEVLASYFLNQRICEAKSF